MTPETISTQTEFEVEEEQVMVRFDFIFAIHTISFSILDFL